MGNGKIGGGPCFRVFPLVDKNKSSHVLFNVLNTLWRGVAPGLRAPPRPGNTRVPKNNEITNGLRVFGIRVKNVAKT